MRRSHSGIGTGWGSASGASAQKCWKLECDRLPAGILYRPGTCSLLNTILYLRHCRVRAQTRIMICLFFDVKLFNICMTP